MKASSHSRDTISGGVFEILYIKTNKKLLKRLAEAEEVKVRVSGSNGTVDGSLDPEQLFLFGEFLEQRAALKSELKK